MTVQEGSIGCLAGNKAIKVGTEGVGCAHIAVGNGEVAYCALVNHAEQTIVIVIGFDK